MDLWVIDRHGYDRNEIEWHGSKFLLANGYMGVRGTLDEYRKQQLTAVNLSGVYDKTADKWRESVNAPNGFYTHLEVNNTRIGLPETEISAHYQALDFKRGIFSRRTVFSTQKGALTVCAERLVSLTDIHTAALKFSLTADFEGVITLVTGIDADIWDINGPHLSGFETEVMQGLIRVKAVTNEKKTVVEVSEKAAFDFEAKQSITTDNNSVLRRVEINVKRGETYTMQKTVTVYTSEDEDYESRFSAVAATTSFDALLAAHCAAWQRIWDVSAVKICGDNDAMRALNYSIFQLQSIAPRHRQGLSIPARGLSGQVYKGAVFWDTEMFMLDHFLFTDPKTAKSLLRYRIDCLGGAKDKAKSYGYEGAFFAWESHEGGVDACSDYNVTDVFSNRPMRTYFKDKQVHISAAVVYGMHKYLNITQDTEILFEGGAELIIECALFYRSLLLKRAVKDYYEIHDVIGPDEYHERVNNNAYTNKMARFVFLKAAEVIDIVLKRSKELKSYDLPALKQEFSFCAAGLYQKQPRADGVIEQFDGYFELEDADINTVKSRIKHEREYWGGANGVASHTQIIKQADVAAMLVMFLHDYDKKTLLANYNYYEPRTEHGSSLSACMYALLAAAAYNADKAYPYFLKSALSDLNSPSKLWAGDIFIGGSHPAAAGGAYIAAIYAFAGIKTGSVELKAEPRLPSKWQSMEFKLKYRGTVYQISINKDKAKIQALEERT